MFLGGCRFPARRSWNVGSERSLGELAELYNSPVFPSLAHSMSIGMGPISLGRIVLFDQTSPPGQGEHLLIGQTQLLTFFGADLYESGGLMNASRIDQFFLFSSDGSL